MMTLYKHLDSIETLHCEEIGGGVFYISKLPNDELKFTFKDKHGIFNIFPNMNEVFNYVMGMDSGRACVEDEYFAEHDARYEEGGDAMDIYLNNYVEKQNATN
jgi:hypothetical protein